MHYYLAIDIGASSGRHIVGWQEDGAIHTKEVYRFPNGVHSENGHLVWDVAALLREVKSGIIVHDDDALSCLAIHADANVRLAACFGLAENAFPGINVTELAAGVYKAETPYLRQRLQNCPYTQEQLLSEPLYPDQMVFLTDTYFQDKDGIDEGQAVSNSHNGELVMRMGRQKAQTLAETLTAVFFIMENIEKAGHKVSTMSDAARNFISNWESEKYRKSMSGRK